MRLTRVEVRAELEDACAAMGLTVPEFTALLEASCCCGDCARPDWSDRYAAWDDACGWHYLLGLDAAGD